MFEKIIDFTKAQIDKNGILVVNDAGAIKQSGEERVEAADMKKLRDKLDDIVRNKLADHWEYIKPTSNFNSQTIYLEIGCWPAHLAEYLMANFDVYFIGIDFNYLRLLTLKKYLEQRGYKKFLLICGDINQMPLKNDSVDFAYGGGVIEHLRNTRRIVDELLRILKIGGVSYNTVPALTFWWLTRFYNTIPALPLFKNVFEFILFKIFRGTAFKKHHGYQQSFTRSQLKKIHTEVGFKDVAVGTFAFHPSDKKLKSAKLREFLYKTRQWPLSAAIYFVHGKK